MNMVNVKYTLKERKDCIHFDVCSVLGSGCKNSVEDPCAYFKKNEEE